ncbi:MAG TPA: tetratricopeptide repeat protein [Polyangiaceae bacterium]|nr:tetratricopeptide repeat protein [Polyangiaceae bacterium]
MAIRSPRQSPSEDPPERSQRLPADRHLDAFGEELEEIKREIVESRALTIKTNNLVNGLSADIHGIGKRQQGYERSLKFSSVGFYAVVLGLVLTGAKIIIDTRVDSERGARKDLEDNAERLEKEIKLLQGREDARVQAERRAAEFHELITAQNRAEVLKRWPEVEKLELTRTERVTFERAVERFRNELSVIAYHAGLDHVRAQRWHEAERALRSSLENKDDAAHSDEARYQLARALRTLGRQREAISMLMELSEGAATREVTDDATLLLAQAQIDIEAWNDAKNTLRNFLRRFPNSPNRNQARAELEKLRLDH